MKALVVALPLSLISCAQSLSPFGGSDLSTITIGHIDGVDYDYAILRAVGLNRAGIDRSDQDITFPEVEQGKNISQKVSVGTYRFELSYYYQGQIVYSSASCDEEAKKSQIHTVYKNEEDNHFSIYICTADGGDPLNLKYNISPLYSTNTQKQEQRNRIDADGVAYTYFGGRVRPRHAREANFAIYRDFPAFYFENRTFEMEVIDRTGAGIKEIEINLTTLRRMNGGPGKPTGRFFFSGNPSPAGYSHVCENNYFQPVGDLSGPGPYKYQCFVRYRMPPNRYPEGWIIKERNFVPGERFEMEITFNLEVIPSSQGPGSGRGAANYYSRAWLLELGKPGLLAWDATGELLGTTTQSYRDSVPLKPVMLSGGATTISADTSGQPAAMMSQTASNIAPQNIQAFVEGRRIFHTDFITGRHHDAENGVFSELVGKAGPLFINSSCTACHVNNGRSKAYPENQPLNDLIFKIGSQEGDQIQAHSTLGKTVQTQSTSGSSESTVSAMFQYKNVQFTDGTSQQLRYPSFTFSDSSIQSFSSRVPRPLVGMGLLEAIDELSILRHADEDDQNNDGISGRPSIVVDPQTRERRLGRFGWKAERFNVIQQVSGAFKTDMGVSSPLHPENDGSTEISTEQLEKVATYVSLLGVPPRRNIDSEAVKKGEELFFSSNCARCHIPSMETGNHHPFAELRNQVIFPYSDLLLHDMGEDLASTLGGEGGASGSEYRTPPLWGLGRAEEVAEGQVGYLHDGRARTLLEAILWHGGEAESAKEKVRQLSREQREQLIAFLKSL